MGKLSAQVIKGLAVPGYYSDYGGLYYVIGKAGNRRWVYRYQMHGRRREMGLGSARDVTLKEARAARAAAAALVLDGVDPLEHRHRGFGQAWTFAAVAEKYIEAHRPGWKSEKHSKQWVSTLARYAYPIIGKKPVADVCTDDVLAILNPIWRSKAETAKRVRGRVAAVLDYAAARGWRDAQNPAQLSGHLDKLLPARAKVSKVTPFEAVPYADMPALYTDLGQRTAMAALALRFLILTASRTNEVLSMSWCEVDFLEKVWTIPDVRMKAGKAHRVPLVPEMMELLKTVPRRRGCDFVFYGQKAKPLSNMAMLMLLRRMGLGQYTVHGFRSTFRDWVAEQTSFAGELAEMALAHTVQNKVEAAYRRGDMFARRRTLMEHWAGYVTGRPVGLELQADDLKKRLTPAELAALAAMLQVDGAL